MTTTLLLYRNLTRIQPVGDQLNRVPFCIATHCRHVLGHQHRVTQINCSAVCNCKLEGSYSRNFTTLSDSDCSQSESHQNCLETSCLPPVDLFSHLVIKSDHPEVERVAHSTSGPPQLLVIGLQQQNKHKHQVTTDLQGCIWALPLVRLSHYVLYTLHYLCLQSNLYLWFTPTDL